MAYAKKPMKKPGKGSLVPPRVRPINRPKPGVDTMPVKPRPRPKPPMKPKPKRAR